MDGDGGPPGVPEANHGHGRRCLRYRGGHRRDDGGVPARPGGAVGGRVGRRAGRRRLNTADNAHLSNAIDDRFYEIERVHGADAARLAAQSHGAAIDCIQTIAREEAIDCDFQRVDGYLFPQPGESPDVLPREFAAARRAGLAEVGWRDRAPLPAFDSGPCLRFPRQGQIHPLKYLAGLARAIHRRGGRIHGQTHATSADGGPPARVRVDGGHTVTAGAVIVATNVPVNDLVAIHTKQAPYLTYAIGVRVPNGYVPRGLYWDTMDPYHYVRTQPGPSTPGGEAYDVLIVGGEDHKSAHAADAEDRWRRLESWARERFPRMREVEYRWSGQVMETVDGLAFIGRNPLDKENVYIATGDSGMGMTHGTIAGILLTDLIAGRPNPWAALYDPSRKPLKAAGEFAKENLYVALRYGEWLSPGEVDSPGEVRPGSGAVLRRGLTKLAVYRDEPGALHARSAVCTHLGCIVHWNPGEPGTAPATVRASTATSASSTAPPTAGWRRPIRAPSSPEWASPGCSRRLGKRPADLSAGTHWPPWPAASASACCSARR
jgi:glycine/D-amino acid oxidase-like deaminating enzyme